MDSCEPWPLSGYHYFLTGFISRMKEREGERKWKRDTQRGMRKASMTAAP